MKTVTDPLTVANELRPVLLKLARHLRREVHDLGVTGSQVTLLVQIKQRPGVGIRELAEIEAVSAPRMSQAVDRLVSLALVQRNPGEDRRRVGLELTARGEGVLRSVRKRRTAWLAERLKGLEPDELDALEAAVAPLERLLEAGE
ncbi:MAG TPA: MarR family transcriptional regulator [Gaiellaceae bacterium]|jgi:DNA-binding MarR family transcriptional regulator